MSIGFYVRGRFGEAGREGRVPDFARLVERMEAWIKVQSKTVLWDSWREEAGDGSQSLLVRLHPAGEAMQLTAGESGLLHASCSTSAVGPGYHAWLCDTLHALAREMDIQWMEADPADGTGDETGYFFTGDFHDTQEHFQNWARELAEVVSEQEDINSCSISLPTEIAFVQNRGAVTPLGPRDETWLAEVASGRRSGEDLFPWWEQGVTAAFYLRRALVLMWTRIPWRPSRDDLEQRFMVEAADSLEQAFWLDPGLPFPWREWIELLDLLERKSDLREHLEMMAKLSPPGDPIGYRRGMLARRVRRWSLLLPGSFSESIEEGDYEEGELTMAFSDGDRTVWATFASYAESATGKPAPLHALLPLPPGVEEVLNQEQGEVLVEHENMVWRVSGDRMMRACSAWRDGEEDGKPIRYLRIHAAVEGDTLTCTLVISKPGQQEWADQFFVNIDVAALEPNQDGGGEEEGGKE